MSEADQNHFVSQVHLQPVDRRTNSGEKGSAFNRQSQSGFQLNSLGGPLEGEFLEQRQ